MRRGSSSPTWSWPKSRGEEMSREERPLRVLFLCVGNSVRSQMAEGWARALGKEKVEAHSAGVLAAGVHPLAELVMREAGVDISGQHSKHVEVYDGEEFDLVVTLCGEDEACPFLRGEGKRIHRPFFDPVGSEGTEEERLEAFRKTRDEMRDFLAGLIERYVD